GARGGAPGAWRVGHPAPRAEIDRLALDAEPVRAPPGIDPFFGRPQLPALLHGGPVGALERDQPALAGLPSHRPAPAGVPRYARSSAAMSSLFIFSMASIAAWVSPPSWLVSSSPSWIGMTCQETPKRSFSQPQRPGSPPAEGRASHSR